MSKTIFAIVVILLVSMNAYGESEEFRKTLAEAERGDDQAQYNLAVMYNNGRGVAQDYKEAVKWFRKAAEQGLAEAQFNLAMIYNNGQGVAQDYKEAVNWFRKAAEQGLAEAQSKLALIYNNGEGIPQDYKEAVNWFRKAAKQGFALAQFNLALMYKNGEGITKDYKEAVKWYRKAAEQGHAEAQNSLAFMYALGQGVSQDYKEAVNWLRKAAEQEDEKAQFNLALMYGLGQGVPQDYKEAVNWYRKAAEQGHEKAQLYLGLMYDLGQGIPQDYKEAVKWYLKAAEQGLAEAQNNLACMYGLGQGVIEDYIEAYKWTLLAGMNGYDVSEIKEAVKRQMTSSQIAEAQRLAKEFAEKKERVADQSSSERQIQSSGTGFFVDTDGYLVTACHVVEEAKSIVVITNNGRFDAKVVAKDNNSDFAILKAQGTMFSSLNIAPSSEVKMGDKVFTIGFPNIDVQGTEAKYTEGSISSLSGINNNFRHFQISVPVQSGNSGGPLMDSNGNVIGIIVSKLSDIQMLLYKGTIPQNVNYAVKSSFVLPYLESIPGIEVSGKTDKAVDKQTAIQKSKNATALILCY